MGGPTGLDYNVMFHELDRLGLGKEEYDELFADLRVMESAALTELNQKD